MPDAVLAALVSGLVEREREAEVHARRLDLVWSIYGPTGNAWLSPFRLAKRLDEIDATDEEFGWVAALLQIDERDHTRIDPRWLPAVATGSGGTSL